jgi:cytidine deaminase
MDALVRAAREARAQAYAPYSRYQVGAAIAADDGTIYSGANVENASYGLSLCAERAAQAKLANAGRRRIAAVAVVTASSPPAAPCGMCRQTLAELTRAGDDVPVVLVNDAGERVETTLEALLPRAFRGDALG